MGELVTVVLPAVLLLLSFAMALLEVFKTWQCNIYLLMWSGAVILLSFVLSITTKNKIEIMNFIFIYVIILAIWCFFNMIKQKLS